KQLGAGTNCPPPAGVMVRPREDAEEPKARALAEGVLAEGFSDWPRALPKRDPRHVTVVAYKEDRLIGVAMGGAGARHEGDLLAVCVPRDTEERARVASALVAALHERLALQGVAKIALRTDADDGFWREMLGHAGYAGKPSGGVSMFGIRDLAQLFGEVRPLYEKRMREGKLPDWRGRVMIVGQRLKAGLEIADGQVQVVSGRPRRGDVVVTAPDRTITRFVTGRETPMEGYLQTDATVEPGAGAGVMGLLETLFPQVPWIGHRPVG
ncbi:MAG TPA: hypothetical protein VM283_01465, partial [Armatimonadota bacterium]|nr:hypothetical protein [Armatimonadota bacterium]